MAFVLYAALNAGRFLTKEDPLEKSDAIAVLSGTRLDRPLEAVDLYQAGYAPAIVLTYEIPERALGAAATRGLIRFEGSSLRCRLRRVRVVAPRRLCR